MSLKRSERLKTASPGYLSNLKERASSTTRAASTRKPKARPVMKHGAGLSLANAANQPTKWSASKGGKRKLRELQDWKLSNVPTLDPQDLGAAQSAAKPKLKRQRKGTNDDTPKQDQEKRLRRYRDKAPQSFLEKLHRAQTQRMIVIGRIRIDTETFPSEEIDIVGSTGNIYKVTIGQIPSCTCPDHQKGNECKHKVYALHTVLKAPEKLVYQLAFLLSELREIFNGSSPIPTNKCSASNMDGNRKPIEGECPICYQDYKPAENELVWCKAACGQNIHKSCFRQWMAAQRGTTVRCVFCRTPWEVDHGEVQTLTGAGTINAEGYINVADQFGMSGVRDYSTYNCFSRRAIGLG